MTATPLTLRIGRRDADSPEVSAAGACRSELITAVQPAPRRSTVSGHGNTVRISITLYVDHWDRLTYSSLPVDHGCRYGA